MKNQRTDASTTLILNQSIDENSKDATRLISFGDPFLNLLSTLFDADKIPYAAFLSQKLELNNEFTYVVSPILWEASHNNVFVTKEGLSFQDFDEACIKQYFDALAQFIKSLGGELIWVNATTWLLNLPDAPKINAQPPQMILGKPLMPYLEALSDSSYWTSLLTEIQMLFCSLNPLNPYPIINGVWIYGQGTLDAPLPLKIYTDDEHLMRPLSFIASSLEMVYPLNRIHKDSIYMFNKTDLTHLKPMLSPLKHYKIYAQNDAYAIHKPTLGQRILGYFNHGN